MLPISMTTMATDCIVILLIVTIAAITDYMVNLPIVTVSMATDYMETLHNSR